MAATPDNIEFIGMYSTKSYFAYGLDHSAILLLDKSTILPSLGDLTADTGDRPPAVKPGRL
jgi:hypothetical protein